MTQGCPYCGCREYRNAIHQKKAVLRCAHCNRFWRGEVEPDPDEEKPSYADRTLVLDYTGGPRSIIK